MDVLTEPLLGVQEIRLRRDLHYGEHDPLFVPQVYHPSTPHLICIPLAGTTDSNIMWFLPSEDDFEPIDGHKLSTIPLGLLRHTLVDAFSDEHHRIILRMDTHSSATSSSHPSLSSDPKIKDYRARGRYLLNRLACPMTFNQVRMVWRIAQRVSLELDARITWLQKIAEKFTNAHAWKVPETLMVIGCVTEDPFIVENCYRVSI